MEPSSTTFNNHYLLVTYFIYFHIFPLKYLKINSTHNIKLSPIISEYFSKMVIFSLSYGAIVEEKKKISFYLF